jgi:16S rRNA (cytidine1402-2'-O)-methyltransferase
MSGTLFVVATPIGNLEDITVRALRILREVAVIAAEDTRRTAQLLARHGITTPSTSLHEHNEAGKSASLVARLQRGESIALVSDAGTPTVSDPGGVLIRAAINAGLRVEPIPGPSAVLAALSASGLPTESFAFFGFPPLKANDRKRWFLKMRSFGQTSVFFEAPHRIHATLHELQREVGDCQVAIWRELTKIHEIVVRSPISKITEDALPARGEFTVVVNIGEMTNEPLAPLVDADSLVAEFGELTKIKYTTKRKAISVLAKKHGIPPNTLYAMVEKARKSGQRPK